MNRNNSQKAQNRLDRLETISFEQIQQRAEQARRNRAQLSPVPAEKPEIHADVCPRCGGTETLNYLVDRDGRADLIPPHIPSAMALYEHPGAYIASEACSCLLEKQLQARLAKLMDGGGVPRLYQNMTFDTWDVQPPASRTGKEEARYYAELFANGQLVVDGCERFGLVLSGAVGRGKTGLASCVLMARACRNETVLWVDFSKFIRKIRDTYHTGSENSYEQVVGAAATVPFLLIDDMGDMDASKAISDDLRRNVYDVISERYNELRPTLITTNLSIEQFRATFGARISDRILHLYQWQVVGGTNLRFEG